MSGFFVFFESTFVAKQWNTVKTHFHSILTAASKPLFMQFRQNRIYVNHIFNHIFKQQNTVYFFDNSALGNRASDDSINCPKTLSHWPRAIYRYKHNTHLQWRRLCQHQDCWDLSNNSSALHILKHKQMNMLTRNVINLSFVKAMSSQLFNVICLWGYLLSVC